MGCFGLLTFLPPRDDKHHSIQYGELAQLGERLVCNQEVTGSSPVFSITFRRDIESRQLAGPLKAREQPAGLRPPDVISSASNKASGGKRPVAAERFRGAIFPPE